MSALGPSEHPAVRQTHRYFRSAVVAIAALFTAIGIRYSSFTADITDASGYVSEAHRWLRRDVFGSLPFAFWPGWSGIDLFIPLGYRTSTVAGADVFIYPPGFPLLMAGAVAIGGELAAYLVPPVLGGVLVWATGDLAGRLAGGRASVIAAALMATSAIALSMATGAMSDVPAAACWALSLCLVLRARLLATLAAGLTVSMAILIRPNLAPLALIPAILAITGPHHHRVLRALVFTGAAAIGPALLMWAQYALYGSPLAPGHPGIEQLFALAHVRDNLLRYPRWYAEAHTPIVLLATIAPFVLWRSPGEARAPANAEKRHLLIALVALVVGVYVLYLPYFPYSDWHFLRFMIPGLPAVYALTAGVLAYGIERAPSVARVPALLIVLAATAGAQGLQAYNRQITERWKSNQRVTLAGRYLDGALPQNAIVITFFHSGSVRFHTGREILRPDLMAADQVDMLLSRLERRGYHPYLLVDDQLERAALLARFPDTRLGSLDWPPRARIGTYGRIDLFDLSDPERHARGEWWPIDIVR